MIYDTPRLRAKAAGLKRYEGLRCINCGGTTRYVCNQQCVVCKNVKKNARRKKHQKYGKKGRPPTLNKLSPEEIKERQQKKREYNRAYSRAYQANPKNKAALRAKRAKRRCNEIQRIPKWLTKTDKKKIKEIYKQAVAMTATTGVEYHVDHIIPLKGKLVSGLHVVNNLQIITAKDNMQKSAEYIP